jgi:hypothetical protein
MINTQLRGGKKPKVVTGKYENFETVFIPVSVLKLLVLLGWLPSFHFRFHNFICLFFRFPPDLLLRLVQVF